MPSLNQIRSNTKGRAGWKYRNTREHLWRMLRMPAEAISPAEEKRRILVTRLYAKNKRPYDRDNLVGGGKPLIDALRQHKLIVDDKPKWTEVVYKQEPSYDDLDHIKIEIQVLENTDVS